MAFRDKLVSTLWRLNRIFKIVFGVNGIRSFWYNFKQRFGLKKIDLIGKLMGKNKYE